MLPAQARTTGARPGSRAIHLTLAALVSVFLIVHLPWLVTAPGDVDEVNFVMGVREFNVAAHQPHPPGYPVFIALGKLAYPLSARWDGSPANHAGPAAAESRALAIWAALFGALGLVPLFVLLRSLDDREDVALAATALTAAVPLYWFTAARPLSDVPGLAAVLLVDALLVAAWHRQHASADSPDAAAPAWSPERLMLASALAAGLTVGIRSQTFWLVAPLFVFVVATWRGARLRMLFLCVFVWTLAVTAWVVPMLAATGGLAPYLNVFRQQFNEDAALVEMLWTQPTRQNVVLWFTVKFLDPWGPAPLALTVLGFAAVGAATLARRRHAALPLAVAFVPYLVFDALFQEVVTVRYALPSVPLIAYLAVRGLERTTYWWQRAVGALVAACLVVGSIALIDQSRDLPPVSRVLADMRAARAQGATAGPVAMHQPYLPMLRHEQFTEQLLPLTPMYEWLDLAKYWLDGGRPSIWFLADPRRAGLAEIDPRSRRLVGTYGFVHRWRFTSALLGGSRPARLQWWALGQPGWMLDEGWALTPEASGVARAGHRFPQDGPVVAHVRRRPGAAKLMIGGRHLDPGDSRPAELTAAIDGRPIASWMVAPEPGWFLQWVDLAPGALAGSGEYATLSVSAASPSPRVGLEQFDLQSHDTEILAFGEGWYELEYDNRRGRSWRWTSERATVIVRHAGRDLTLRLTGESPLRYFDTPATVTVRAGDYVLVRFTPSSDFDEEITVPAARLDRPYGRIVVETDQTFTPAERGGSEDRRRLGLRVFELTLR